ncbi:MAG TPA: NAD(P)-dependent oxidoreductase [Candidatus Udaeobacter sp.]|jgi:3-hydroxyisobutyrate dehydrogenase|nr:NAD(P)-dependent oxidoreductase [Candidatus Udaeobacter sp.]
MERIGMIGVGAMGLALLERLRLAGDHATVYDIYAPALEQARVLGCKVVSSPAEVAKESTLVDIVVRTDGDVVQCMTGPDGVLRGAQPGTLVILHSTILPQTVKKMEEEARGKSVHVVDACMAGVPAAVRAGNLSFLVGGSKEVIPRAELHLLKMGKQVFHTGPVGAGAVAKLIHNMVIGAETLIIHEAIQIGLAGGIPYPQALEMMRQIGHDSVLNRWQRTFDPAGTNPLPKSGRNVMNKDVPLAAELARLYGLDVPITQELAKAAVRIVKANPAD